MMKIRDRIRKLSIKRKLIIFMTAIIVTIGLFNLYFFNKAYQSMEDYNNLLKDYIQVNNLSLQLVESRECISRYISTKERSEIDQYFKIKKDMDALSDSILNTSSTLDTYVLSQAIANSLESYEYAISYTIGNTMGTSKNNENYYSQFQKAKNISLYIGDYIKQLLYIKLAEGEWYHSQLSQRVAFLRGLNLFSLAGVMVFSLIYAIMFSRSINVPLKRLTQFAFNVSHGDFDTGRLKFESSEDINIVVSAFNTMSTSIKKMIDVDRRLHEEELKSLRISEQLNEARFLALQSQINPHFLFNTLNAIMRISMFEKSTKTTNLIQSLADIFRYNLGDLHKEVLLSEELDVVKEYMSIQKLRFGDRVDLSVVCKADITSVYIPRFIIQPLVENSIVHGIEPKEQGGRVRIKVYISGNRYEIKISDNGIGMSKKQLEGITTGRSETGNQRGQTTGIGISNVRERLMLHYKNNECFTVRSREGTGTVITIRI